MTASLAHATTLKGTAPQEYVVQPGDTLWDISALYLDTPWLWPQLWRNNADLTNPHLIFPGDVIRIVIGEDGEPTLTLERETKKSKVLSPSGKAITKKNSPIDLLPWTLIAPYIQHDRVIAQGEYDALPQLLGDQDGSLLFSDHDVVFGEATNDANNRYSVVRKQNTYRNEEGEVIGVQIREVATATETFEQPDNNVLVRVSGNNVEARPGDRLIQMEDPVGDLALTVATSQTGTVIESLELRRLMGKFDIVVVDIGKDELTPGTVMGIYSQGPDVFADTPPVYDEDADLVGKWTSGSSRVAQPALKVGELVVFKTFDATSYGLITKASKTIRTGAIVAHP